MGLFGKLPAHGDFVRRGDPALAQRLDAWLTGEVERVAAAWDDAYDIRVSALPTWSFVLADGLAGALAASHDRVGRVFPVVACVAGGRAAAERTATLFADSERTLLDADAIQAALAAMADEDQTSSGGARWWRPLHADPATFSIAGLASGPDFVRLFEEMA